MIFLLAGLALTGLAMFALTRVRRMVSEEGDGLATGATFVLFVGLVAAVFSATVLTAPLLRDAVEPLPWWLRAAISGASIGLAIYLGSGLLLDFCGMALRWARNELDQTDETVGFWVRRHSYAVAGVMVIFAIGGISVSSLDTSAFAPWIVAAMCVAINLYEPWVMPWFLYYRAKTIDRTEHGEVHQWLDQVAVKHNVPKFHLRVREGGMLNALATGGVGRHFIVVGQGLLEQIPTDHLKAILAHEVGHILNRDLSRRLVPVVCIAAFIFSFYLEFVVAPQESTLRNVIAMVLGLTLIWYILPGFFLRRREYDADRKAAELIGDAEAVAQALEAFAEVTGTPLDHRSSTHPTMRKRIEAIRRLGGEHGSSQRPAST